MKPRRRAALHQPVRVRVRVTPRASFPRIAYAGGVLRVWVTAPPVEGRANLEARQLIADALGVARRDVVIESGARGRDKVVVVPDEAGARLL